MALLLSCTEILLTGEPAIRNLRGDGRHKGTAQRGTIVSCKGQNWRNENERF
jgi:hypothetical protein